MEVKLCECGCDKTVKKGNRFINGHNYRGVRFSHTEETKRKISEIKKKNCACPEYRKRLSKALTGVKRSEETKRRMSEGKMGRPNLKLIGRKSSEETKRKISKYMSENNPSTRPEVAAKIALSLSGPGNPQWRGGISCEPYCEVWLDKEYKQSIMDRDGNKCINPDCWGTSNRLYLHHINYKKKDCSPRNLCTVCNSCNCRANNDRSWWKAWYRAIMYRRYNL